MSISISGIIFAGETVMCPTSVVVELECDSASEFFCCGVEKFTHPDGYIGAHADAMKKGWLERQGPQGRIWLCPACSGK